MARGTSLLNLVSRVKALSGRSTDVSVGVDDVPKIKEVINTVYSTMYLDYDWPHLRVAFERIPLLAGERYYDLPTGLNVERLESVNAWFGGLAIPIDRGITDDDYSIFDSDAGEGDPPEQERAEPVLKWDIRWTGSSDQIEIWPRPTTNDQTIRFVGIQDAPRLVNESDLCLLDDTAVCAFAAALLIKDKDDSEKIRQIGVNQLANLKSRSKTTSIGTRLGLDRPAERYPMGVTVRVR
jgi:hypothetical protein